MLTHQTCTTCNVHKPITAFNKVKADSSRYRTQCRECVSEYNRRRREEAQGKLKHRRFKSAHSVKLGQISEIRVQLRCLQYGMRISRPLQQQKGFDLVVITGPRTHDRWQTKTAHIAGTSKWWSHIGDPSRYEYLIVVHPDKDIFWMVPSKEIPKGSKKPIRMNNKWMWE